MEEGADVQLMCQLPEESHTIVWKFLPRGVSITDDAVILETNNDDDHNVVNIVCSLHSVPEPCVCCITVYDIDW